MVDVDPPTERSCERCGRLEVWDRERTTWSVADDAEDAQGRPHCLHEWDINGAYNPLAD